MSTRDADDDTKSPENETVDMKWSDWFREKHYFQVKKNIIPKTRPIEVCMSTRQFYSFRQVGILVVLGRLFLNLNQAFLPLFLQEGIRAPQVLEEN